MNTPLLQTKLYIPSPRPNLVPRPRLIERLNEGLTRKLTLISAPAGYGKMTLVNSRLSEAKPPAAWLSLDELDNEPAQFLRYFVAGLEKVRLLILPLVNCYKANKDWSRILSLRTCSMPWQPIRSR